MEIRASLEERNIMRAIIWKTLAVGGVAIGAMCGVASAQGADYAAPVITITAGQGGALRLPAVSVIAQPYTLTGESSQLDRARRDWQQQAGPRMRVGQSEITLPASR